MDELLSKPKITAFLAKSSSKLHEPTPSNAILQPLLVDLLFIAFLTNLSVPNKQYLSVKLFVKLRGQVCNS